MTSLVIISCAQHHNLVVFLFSKRIITILSNGILVRYENLILQLLNVQNFCELNRAKQILTVNTKSKLVWILDEIAVVILSIHLPNLNRIQHYSSICVSLVCNYKIDLPIVLDLKIIYLYKYKTITVEEKKNKEHMA